jgi:DNA (cytosine-5)-methyltransferase 1
MYIELSSYQVRVKVLQAGQYGAPQSRKRVIFWGAKRGILLPEFPKPTHAFQASFFYKLPTGDTLQPATRSKDPKRPHQLAPLNAVTVNDAIGDLVGTRPASFA